MHFSRIPLTASAVVVASLCAALAGGCASTGTTTSTDSGSDATTGAASDSASSTTDSGASSTDSGDTAATATFDYSGPLDDEGHWDGVTALDLVKLPSDYASISIAEADVAPTDDEVQAQIDQLVSNNTTTKQVTDREIVDGDSVNIDFVGTVDGVEFEGGNTNGAGTTVVIGTTSMVDGFVDQLIGHTPGESFDIEVTFPDDYKTEDLQGKDAVFAVTVNYITETVTPEVTDEWVAETYESSYGWTTVDGMTQAITDTLRSEAISNYVQDYVVDNSTISEVPQSLTTYQEDLLVWQYQSYADSFGVELEQMLSMAAGVDSVDALYEANREALDKTAAAYLVFQAIAEDAGITVSDDEMVEYFTTSMGVSDTTEIEDAYGKPYLKLCVLVSRVTDLLTSGATIA